MNKAHSSSHTRTIVDSHFHGPQGEVIDGCRFFQTIQSALDAAPDDINIPYAIYIRDGRYQEKIRITRPNVSLLGHCRDKTIICWDDYSGIKGPDGANIGTWKCATLIIQAPHFRAENLTIENCFDYLQNDAKEANDPSKSDHPQGVALMTAAGSDCAFFRNVCLLGYQDTLFVASGRSYFSHSTIAGNIDFIFGAGQAVLDDCDIVTRPRSADVSGTVTAYITAPSTQRTEPYGIVITHSRLKKESAAVLPETSALGRPWHPTTTFSDGCYADPNAIGMASFINCWMDDHIATKGWDGMPGTGRIAGTKDWFASDNPEHARFFEFGSTGPGAASHPKRPQLSAEKIHAFTIEKILGGWNPIAR